MKHHSLGWGHSLADEYPSLIAALPAVLYEEYIQRSLPHPLTTAPVRAPLKRSPQSGERTASIGNEENGRGVTTCSIQHVVQKSAVFPSFTAVMVSHSMVGVGGISGENQTSESQFAVVCKPI